MASFLELFAPEWIKNRDMQKINQFMKLGGDPTKEIMEAYERQSGPGTFPTTRTSGMLEPQVAPGGMGQPPGPSGADVVGGGTPGQPGMGNIVASNIPLEVPATGEQMQIREAMRGGRAAGYGQGEGAMALGEYLGPRMRQKGEQYESFYKSRGEPMGEGEGAFDVAEYVGDIDRNPPAEQPEQTVPIPGYDEEMPISVGHYYLNKGGGKGVGKPEDAPAYVQMSFRYLMKFGAPTGLDQNLIWAELVEPGSAARLKESMETGMSERAKGMLAMHWKIVENFMRTQAAQAGMKGLNPENPFELKVQ